ncbi:MAG: class I SAM-dependent methyltransferase [Fimbriimonas sp.]
MTDLKTRLKSTWEAGDYGVFAKNLEPGALEFFERLDLAPGTRLLDVACGAGQLTIPAAKRGIDVVGVDLAQNLVDQANERAKAEGLDIRIEQGDAEALPFEDASFDVVMSLIGSMFAPRPELVASEMLRVCRAGGKAIMGNWTPAGHVGQMFKIVGSHVPPPAIFPSPLMWGNEEKVRERLGNGVSDLRITPRLYPFRYPFSPTEVVDFFFAYYGPTVKAYGALNEEGRERLRSELIELWTTNNLATDGTTHVMAEYIEVVGTKA